MGIRRILRIVSASLFFFLFLIYVAAKFDFFVHYSELGTRSYLKEHSIYWVAMAAVALLVWLLERYRHSS